MGVDGAVVRVDGENVYYRASAIGSPCTKQLIAARMEYEGLPTPTKTQEVFDRGTEVEFPLLHQLAVEMPKQWSTYGRNQKVELWLSKRIAVVGHVDAIRIPSYRVVEVKSQSKKEYEPGKFHESSFYDRYLWQISSYMHATGYACDVVVACREINDERKFDYYVVSFEEPPISKDDIRKRVLRIEAEGRKDRLPEKCEEVCYPCPYYYLHESVGRGDGGERLKIEDEDLVVMAKQYDRARREEKQAKERKEATKKALDAVMPEDKCELETDDGPVLVTFYEGSTSVLARQRMEQDGIDLKKYTDKVKYRGLRVTMP